MLLYVFYFAQPQYTKTERADQRIANSRMA